MMGHFAGEFFRAAGNGLPQGSSRGLLLRSQPHWLEEYHSTASATTTCPACTTAPVGHGYADWSTGPTSTRRRAPAFQARDGRSTIIQCAEHLPDARGHPFETYSNCCWQNGLLDRAREMATGTTSASTSPTSSTRSSSATPAEYQQPRHRRDVPGRAFSVFRVARPSALHQPLSGTHGPRDLLGEAYGDRALLQGSALRDRPLHGQGHPDALARPGVGRELGASGGGSGATSSSARCTGSTSTTSPGGRSCGFTASWAGCGVEPPGAASARLLLLLRKRRPSKAGRPCIPPGGARRCRPGEGRRATRGAARCAPQLFRRPCTGLGPVLARRTLARAHRRRGRPGRGRRRPVDAGRCPLQLRCHLRARLSTRPTGTRVGSAPRAAPTSRRPCPTCWRSARSSFRRPGATTRTSRPSATRCSITHARPGGVAYPLARHAVQDPHTRPGWGVYGAMGRPGAAGSRRRPWRAPRSAPSSTSGGCGCGWCRGTRRQPQGSAEPVTA